MKIAAVIVGIGLIAWFFIAWLALGQNVVDAAGESVGSGLVILLLVSIVGAVLRKKVNGAGDEPPPPNNPS